MATATKTKNKKINRTKKSKTTARLTFNKTPEQARRLWIKALESGNYRQANGVLKEPGTKSQRATYCCLGVACNEFSKYEPEAGMYFDESCFTNKTNSQYGDGEMPLIVCQWLGINKQNCGVEEVDGRIENLACLNDDSGYNFKQIAEVIKREDKKSKLGKSEFFKKVVSKKGKK